MPTYGESPDRLGIWESKQPSEPFKLQADETDDYQIYEDVRPDNPWWRVSILTVATSLIAFTLGAGAAQFVRPAPVYVSPQLEIGIAAAPSHNVRERVKGKVIRKDANRRHSRRSWVDRRLAAARAKNAAGQTRQPGTVIVAAVPTASAATSTSTSSDGSVRLIKNSSGPELITKQSKPAGTQTTQSQAPPQEEESSELGAEENATNEDESTANDPDDSSSNDTDDDEVESTEPDEPGNSEDAPGHNKPPKG